MVNERRNKKKREPIVRRTLSFMLKTAWKEKKSLYLAYVGMFVAEFITTMKNVLLPKFLIDELVLVIEGAALSKHLQQILFYTVLIIGLEFLASLLRRIGERSKIILREWFNGYFEVMLAERAMKMDFEHTEDPAVLDQLNRAKEGISWYSGNVVGILDAAYQIVLNAAVLISVLSIIFLKCPLLLPIQLLALFLISVYNARNNKIDEESFLELAKLNRVFGYILFRLANFQYGKDIRLYDSSEMMSNKAKLQVGKMVGVWKDQAGRAKGNLWKMDIVNSLRDGISYFYIGYLAITKEISVGDFTMCVSSASELYWSIHRMITFAMDIRKRSNYAYQFLLFLDYPSLLKTGDKAVCKGEHVIEFRNVSFRYPRCEDYVLRNINLTIQSGEHLSVVGLNGAGKTTLVKLLCRLYAVTEGEICIDGINILEYDEEDYRKLFAVVFQDFRLFAFSLRENITMGDTKYSEEEIQRVLELCGFYDNAKTLEKGLDTILYKSFDEKGVELSGGQQQKTAISRALYRNAPIVILDEPTAALDPIAECDIYRQFNSLMDGKTAIYISHRLSSCQFCDRIAVFAEETIKEYGTHEELLELPNGIYAEMFRTQARHYVGAE